MPDKSTELQEVGKRVSDTINLKIQFNGWLNIRECWMAFRLSDGTSDNVLYDTKQDAVKHQLHEMQCAYICFTGLAGGAKPIECEIFMKFTRDAYDAGLRLPDPDEGSGGRDLILTSAEGDMYRNQILRRNFRKQMMGKRVGDVIGR